ncbi:hypothetical protein V8E54_014782 [Elaphomyces granulatus]
MEQQSRAQRSNANAVAIAISADFLQLIHEIRLIIYESIGIVSLQSIRKLEWWIDDETNDRVPQPIPKRLLRTSKELSADVLLAFWSENVFRLCGNALFGLLQLGNPTVWSSLRNLTVVLPMMGCSLRSQPGKPDLESTPLLRSWQQVCIHLGAHSPPSNLTLNFELRGAGQLWTAWAQDTLCSMQVLPMLRSLSIALGIYSGTQDQFCFRGVGIHRMGINILKRLTCPSTKRRSYFRFADLPVELQLEILGYTDLVAPGPVIASLLKGYALDSCHGGCRRPGYQCLMGGYDSSKSCCWSLPADLFLVSRNICAMSSWIFFSRNEFVVDVVGRHKARPAPLIWTPTVSGVDPSPRQGVWYPEHSNFLRSFPPTYIPILKSLTWRFMMHSGHLSTELEADWISTIAFIAKNVKPLSRLTVTLDMKGSPLCDEMIVPLQNLRGLQDLFIRFS